MSAVAAYLHSLSMIALASLLVVQLLSLDRLHDRLEMHRFMTRSVGIVAAAVVLLLSGAGLVVWSAKGAAFFLRNPVFYIKLALFAAMLLIAITPARIILQWRQEAVEDRGPEPASTVFVKRYLMVELILLLLIPLAASMAVRGIGLPVSSS
jgi:putative membrane protein